MNNTSAPPADGPRPPLRQYGVIAVGDLEDYSWWCQCTDPEVVATVGQRFAQTIDFYSRLCGCTFWKFTGDGFLALWTFDLGQDDTPSAFLARARPEVVLAIEHAVAFITGLETANRAGFGLAWPTPRAMRSAVHAGMVAKTSFSSPVTPAVPAYLDYVGEAVNGACRMQKMRGDFPGPVLTEHVYRLLNLDEAPRIVGIQAPRPSSLAQEKPPKAADWIAADYYCLPSAMAFDEASDSPFLDSNGRLTPEARDAIETNMASAFYTLLSADPEQMRLASQADWLLNAERWLVSKSFVVALGGPGELAKALRRGLRRSFKRVRMEKDQSHWKRMRVAGVIKMMEDRVMELGRYFERAGPAHVRENPGTRGAAQGRAPRGRSAAPSRPVRRTGGHRRGPRDGSRGKRKGG
jgi:class 3 adenylate cyclase